MLRETQAFSLIKAGSSDAADVGTIARHFAVEIKELAPTELAFKAEFAGYPDRTLTVSPFLVSARQPVTAGGELVIHRTQDLSPMMATLPCGHPRSNHRWVYGDRCTICEKRCTDEAAPGIALAKSGDLQALENWLLANIDKKDTIHKGGVTKSGTRH
jgi:hypothetical protein